MRRRHLPKRRGAERNAGIVEQEVDVAEFGLGPIGRALIGVGVGDVDFDGMGADVEGREFAARDFKLRLLDVGEHDIRPVARQRPADAEADSIGRTSDERGFAGKIHVRRSVASGRNCCGMSWSMASKAAIIASKRCATLSRRSPWVKI